MRAQTCNCRDEYRQGLSGSPSNHRRIDWQKALAALARPMLRLHQLRNIRTQMLRDALNNRDCNNHRGQDA
jgi:hypothetical protein